MRTKKDKESCRMYRAAGTILELYAQTQAVEEARRAGAQAAWHGVEDKSQREELVNAIEKNLINQQKWAFEVLARGAGLAVSERDFHRRKKKYAQAFTDKVGLTLGKKDAML